MLATNADRRVLMVGLDAMEWTLVKKWSAEGKLPNLRRMMETGAHGMLRSTADFLPDTAWTSIICGASPGKLGKYFYVQLDPPSGRLRLVPDSAIRATPVWDHLARAGKRVVVADVPHMPVSREPNVTHLLNWGAHDQPAGSASNPPSLLPEVLSRFGPHPVGDCEAFNQDQRARRRLARLIVESTQLQGDLFGWLMNSRPWDLFMCCFSAAHCAGHQFWAHQDPGYPEHLTADSNLRTAMEDAYRAIDREIGKLLDAAGPETVCLAVASHGMLGLSHASWNMNEMLDLWGFGAVNAAPRRLDKPAAASINPWRILKVVAPSSWQYAIKRRLPQRAQDALVTRWYCGGLTIHGRRAFCVPNNESVALIRINLKGREPDGLVEPGEEYQRLCRDITAAALELTDPVTGRKLVRQVSLLQERYPGTHADVLPDIGIAWDISFPWRAARSPRFGELTLHKKVDSRSGSHSHRSFLAATGPGIPAGSKLSGSAGRDIAPTLLHLSGVPIPSEMDGVPLPALARLVQDAAGSNSPKRKPPPGGAL